MIHSGLTAAGNCEIQGSMSQLGVSAKLARNFTPTSIASGRHHSVLLLLVKAVGCYIITIIYK